MIDFNTSRRDFIRGCASGASAFLVSSMHNGSNRVNVDNAVNYLDSSKEHKQTPNLKVLKDLSSNNNSEFAWDLVQTAGVLWGDQKLGAREYAMLEDACHHYDEIERLGNIPSEAMEQAMDNLELSLDGKVADLKRSKIKRVKPFINLLKAIGVGGAFSAHKYLLSDPGAGVKEQISFVNDHTQLSQTKKDALVNHLKSLNRRQKTFSTAHKAFFLTLIALYAIEYKMKLPHFLEYVQGELAHAARESFRRNDQLEIRPAKNFSTLLGDMIPPEMGEETFNKNIFLTLTPRLNANNDANNDFYHRERVFPVFYIDRDTLMQKGFDLEDAEKKEGFYFGYEKTLYDLNAVANQYFETAKFSLHGRNDGDDPEPPPSEDDHPPTIKLPSDIRFGKPDSVPFIVAKAN